MLEAPRPTRTVVFPEGRSMGRLSWLSRLELHEGLERWRALGEATGSVSVPADSAVRLDVNLEAHEDPSPLKRLAADDLQWLSFHAWGPSTRTDHALSCIRHMTGLEGLDLAGTHVTDSGLAHIASLAQLRALLLEGNPVTDAGLAHLAALTKLETLELWGSRVTVSDAGLVHLAQLTALHDLTLWGTGVTDDGLVHLHRLTSLRRLGLSGTDVTDAGCEELRRALPGLESIT
jgi:Leucine-rich repeat (LRR) protein